MISSYKTIKAAIENNVLKIILNRPEKRNALNKMMVTELNDIFNRFKDDESIFGISLTGAGEAFCAGADLSYLKSLLGKSYQENLEDSMNLRRMYWSIYSFPKPTVALVNGPAIAGGCGLMNVFDIAFASGQAFFGYPEVKIGFVASIVSVFLVQTVGLQQAKYLLLSGKKIDAEEAEKIGLIHSIIRNGNLQTAARQFFKQIRENSPQAVLQTKRLLHQISDDKMEVLLDQACDFNARSRQLSDFKEGILSFLEKRDPEWT
jgi:methylglutaconyl-CoA hydratase